MKWHENIAKQLVVVLVPYLKPETYVENNFESMWSILSSKISLGKTKKNIYSKFL